MKTKQNILPAAIYTAILWTTVYYWAVEHSEFSYSALKLIIGFDFFIATFFMLMFASGLLDGKLKHIERSPGRIAFCVSRDFLVALVVATQGMVVCATLIALVRVSTEYVLFKVKK